MMYLEIDVPLDYCGQGGVTEKWRVREDPERPGWVTIDIQGSDDGRSDGGHSMRTEDFRAKIARHRQNGYLRKRSGTI